MSILLAQDLLIVLEGIKIQVYKPVIKYFKFPQKITGTGRHGIGYCRV